jgi:carbohydrate kinase (thermoresistant glucokinase family)
VSGEIVIVMGVSGSGKTTVGELLADACGVPFCDADRLHPPANVAKMAAGHPLVDEDRWPWLRTLVNWMDEHGGPDAPPSATHPPIVAVVGCSSLKRSYRDVLRQARTPVRFAYLKGDRRLLSSRLHRRKGHFFPEALLNAQLADLEEPRPDEQPVVVSIGDAPPKIVREILDGLAKPAPEAPASHKTVR